MIAHGVLLAGSLLLGQAGDMSGGASTAKKSYVTYVAEPQEVPAGKPGTLTLHFRVMPGFHVNSHTPKSEFLIPTKVEMQPADGVRAGQIEYPAGHSYSFSFSPDEKLDVYSDDFTVKLPVAASRGAHEMDGTLRYQACDKAACYPPRSLSIQVLFTAR